jgi:uncharacterized protein with ParB-like and HNH nuclease domain
MASTIVEGTYKSVPRRLVLHPAMNAKETKVQPLIEGTKQFVVPLFQRPYSWERKHWEMLWGDLMDLYEEEQPRNHFMGSVVTMPAVSVPEGVTKYVLIDGQQRITTILLLLALIRDLARSSPGTLANQIEDLLLFNRYQEGTDTFKLLPTQVDRETFVKIMLGEQVAGENQITRSYKYFDKLLRSSDSLNLEKLRGIIIRNLVLVSIVLDSDDNPHLIFESLNAKGRALTQADLIRNYFFMRMHADQQEQMYATYWAPLLERLGEDLTECIRHFLMKDGAVVKQGEVFFTLKERGDRKTQQQVIEYLKELAKFAGYYDRLLHPEREPNAAVRRGMQMLNRLEVTTAYPFLLNVYDDFARGAITEAQAVETLDVLENFVFRRFVCGIPTNTLNKIFPQLYAQSLQSGDLVAGVKAVLAMKNYPRDAEFRERFKAARFYGGDRGVKGKLALERLEESFGHRESVQTDDLTIEHVMPQTLTDWWKTHLGADWEHAHARSLDTIGNLTLSGYNPQLSNADYPEKREILRASHLELNRHFADVSDWTEASISERAEALAVRALQIWSYFGPRQEEPDQSGEADAEQEEPVGGFDLAEVFSVLGGGAACTVDSRLQIYQLNDGKRAIIKYSKLHNMNNRRRNLYWYGMKPGVIQDLRTASVSHVVFVMGRFGLAAVPIELVEAYCERANVTNHADGTLRHYHVVISNELEPHMVPSQGNPRYSLGDYFKTFEPTTQG